MTEENEQLSPDKLVENNILAAFESEGVCDTEALKAIGNKISTGALKDVDWSMIFENLVDREAKSESGQKDEN